MKIDNIIVVIGLKNPRTELAESLCRSMGVEVYYAVKKSDPDIRIESVSEEAVVTPSVEQLAPSIFRQGLMASDDLFEKGELDCNFTNEREMFGNLLGWLVYNIPQESDVPNGWQILEVARSRFEQGFDPRMEHYRKGQILSGGRVVVNFGAGNKLMQLPESYVEIFAVMEGFCI